MSKELTDLQQTAYQALYHINKYVMLNHGTDHNLVKDSMRWLVEINDKLTEMVDRIKLAERTQVALYCHVCDKIRPIVMRIAEGGYYIQDVYKDKDGKLTQGKLEPTVIGPFRYHCKCCGVMLAQNTYELEQELSKPGANELVANLSDSVDDMPWEVRHFDEINEKLDSQSKDPNKKDK